MCVGGVCVCGCWCRHRCWRRCWCQCKCMACIHVCMHAYINAGMYKCMHVCLFEHMYYACTSNIYFLERSCTGCKTLPKQANRSGWKHVCPISNITSVVNIPHQPFDLKSMLTWVIQSLTPFYAICILKQVEPRFEIKSTILNTSLIYRSKSNPGVQ